jgi:hypothetical protein
VGFTDPLSGTLKLTGLAASHPLVKFAKDPENIDCTIALDDTVIWGALSLMADAKDECLATLAKRLRDRKLYKCIDVRTCIAQEKVMPLQAVRKQIEFVRIFATKYLRGPIHKRVRLPAH